MCKQVNTIVRHNMSFILFMIGELINPDNGFTFNKHRPLLKAIMAKT